MQEITSELNGRVYGQLADMAGMRQQASEAGLMAVGRFDPDSEYHDLSQAVFPATHNVAPEALLHMGELILNNFNTKAYKPGTTETVEAVIDSLRKPLAPVRQRIADGHKVMLLTAHETRFEPAVVTFLAQAAMAESPAQQNAMRSASSIIISRYLACFNINVGKMAGGENKYINMVSLARELGVTALSFPNTKNMDELSGLDKGFRYGYNSRMREQLTEHDKVQLCVIAANGTMEQKVGGVYPISEVKSGTQKLIQDGWDVMTIASAHSADEPFSVASRLIPAREVTDEVVHNQMHWIADTLTERGTPATYMANRS